MTLLTISERIYLYIAAARVQYNAAYYIRQVNGMKLAYMLFSLLSVCLSVCLCVCAHSVQSSTVCVPPTTHQRLDYYSVTANISKMVQAIG